MCLGYLTLSYSSRRINRLFEERLAKDAFIWFASKPASYSKFRLKITYTCIQTKLAFSTLTAVFHHLPAISNIFCVDEGAL